MVCKLAVKQQSAALASMRPVRYLEGVLRRHERVLGYALILVTDVHPAFRLRA